MTTISFKHSIGDKVWVAGSSYKQTSVLCPSCFGTKEWTIIFGDGSREQCPCQTCKRGWEPGTGYLYFNEWQPTVRLVTIGSVRFNDEAEYMCEETGLGSGALYRDKDIFGTEEEAQAEAEIIYEKQMADLAANNFKKRGRFAQDLSTYGFVKGDNYRKEREMKRWVSIVKNSKIAPKEPEEAA
jgi:hypothetical protein